MLAFENFITYDTNHNIIVMHTMDNSLDFLGFSDETYLEISRQISLACNKHNTNKIEFSFASEGLPYRSLLGIDKIVRHLIETFGFSTETMNVLSGISDCKENYIHYHNNCKKFNLVPLKIKFMNSYEILARIRVNNDLSFYLNHQRKIGKKNKAFLCFNRTPKYHRMYITAEVINRNLLDKAYFSMYLNAGEDDGMNESLSKIRSFELMYNLCPKLAPTIDKTIIENIDKFPLRLSLHKTLDDQHSLINDIDLYNDSNFGVATETKFFKDTMDIDLLKDDLSLDCVLFSEKTFKFIMGKLPFIIVGVPNSIKTLNELGFKTFHPYIDESYDSILDDEQRLEAIMDEIERLCNYSDEEFIRFQENTLPMVEHNFKKLLNE